MDNTLLQDQLSTVNAETKIYPGTNVGMGVDHTLFCKIDGIVKFERLGRDKKQVSVYPEAK